MKKIDVILKNEPGVRYSNAIAGYSVLAQTTSTRSGTYFCLLQPFDQRKSPDMQAVTIVSQLNPKLFSVLYASDFVFPSHALPGHLLAIDLAFTLPPPT